MPSNKILTPIEPGNSYHIYNRGLNHQKVFFREKDYHLFLERFTYFLVDYCDLYAYCLLPNHYHFVLRVNDENGDKFSRQIGSFIVSYTNKVNLRKDRNGGLFMKPFRRILVDRDDYLKRLIFYVNHNAAKHDLVKNFRDYRFGSYPAMLSDEETIVARDKVFQIFNDKSEFVEYHNFRHEDFKIRKYLLED